MGNQKDENNPAEETQNNISDNSQEEKPDSNIEAPKFDLVTEGYIPSKNKNDKAK